MTRYRMYCPDCGAEGETGDKYIVDELLSLHDDQHLCHAPDYEVVERAPR